MGPGVVARVARYACAVVARVVRILQLIRSESPARTGAISSMLRLIFLRLQFPRLFPAETETGQSLQFFGLRACAVENCQQNCEHCQPLV